ncbi:MAG: guanosine-3',5'-bis(diphosphate) 3'-pyrophosphohydrolase [Cellvibrionaceae bacterium]
MQIEKIFEVLEYASELHKDQRRKGNGGSPYVNHLIEVASLLSRVAKVTDQEVIIAAILHDALEDTDAREGDIFDLFGDTVLGYVKHLTDDKTLSLEKRRIAQLKSIENSSSQIQLIKLADHCSNIASLPPSWDRARLESYISWSHSIAVHCYSASEELAKVYKKRYDSALEICVSQA